MTLVIFAVGAIAALLPLTARSVEREVVVVARQMSFYVDDGVTANPTIRVSPGERVRLTLISADPGFDHDFSIAAWGVSTPMLHGAGRTSIVIQVPETAGTTTYVCSIHASMMSGVIEVVAPSTAAPTD
jgi:plastocyanin